MSHGLMKKIVFWPFSIKWEKLLNNYRGYFNGNQEQFARD